MTVSVPSIPSTLLAEVRHVVAIVCALDIFPGPDPNAQMREIESWLKSKGVRDFGPVLLFCDQLTKVKPLVAMHHLTLSHRKR